MSSIGRPSLREGETRIKNEEPSLLLLLVLLLAIRGVALALSLLAAIRTPLDCIFSFVQAQYSHLRPNSYIHYALFAPL